ncbi:DNA-directed RNA polymerase subunit beta' [Capillibacterium thermochitinicola]|uniref:DNA-directed RNA polymerase subunit beta' n=1 Tax=Capillibacterium thermochitinicola TaxID=2699427 RepID=A0A8J6LMP6_9FIRM|nr:DNA-directed RNA polymerase subunit beta' [Capillibacterium thermochitinicola]MBA2133984.1 DNA-directed RNA polymerase subunit beta' [Capillibacterium thermochitinicola]
MLDANNFDAIKIGLASPEQIRAWSSGEVKKPETINYRTLKPEREGLFCEKIFGPQRDWECHCGKYKRVRYKGIVCDRCGVEVTRSKVRRERLGHIELAAPVSHIWYFKGIPSRMGLLLDMSPRALEKVLYFASYVVIDPGPEETTLSKKQLLSENEYREALEKYGNSFVAMMGAEAIKKLLEEIDLDQLAAELKKEIREVSGQRKVRAIRRLEVVEALRKSGNRPEWMIMDVIPVIPPELRPMVQLDGGRFATSDLNDLYRRVINRNNRLKRLLELGAPDIIVRNEKRMLQEAVDALFDNGRRGRPVTGPGNRPLKSLSDMLRGKQGRFRQNLLGKRVDYSGRSVIVVGPDLKIHQCGLPKEMALELFKPFVMKKLVDQGFVHNIKSAKRMVEKARPEVWDVLEEVIKEHPVLLNRAPTLHRLGIQAFEPVLVEGRAIQVHPLVCPAYNADFDGDQMAVHVPLSAEAQAEARILMLSAHNILSPAHGRPLATPNQDVVIGCYYLTIIRKGMKGEGRYFSSPEEAMLAYYTGNIALHAKITVRTEKGRIETSVGRLIFKDQVSIDPDYLDEIFAEIGDHGTTRKVLNKIVSFVCQRYGTHRTAEILDQLKRLGYRFATQSGTTIAATDISTPPQKKKIVEETERLGDLIEQQYRRGLITKEERYQRFIDIWAKAKEDVTKAMVENFDPFNSVAMMSTSGARGNVSQLSQLAGMRGLMSDPSGRIIDLPIKANFREGLTVLEFFISTHGARKGLADTALRTADSGYLTRRLVDVAQDVIVREVDCGTNDGIFLTAIKDGDEVIESLEERIVGRIAAEDLADPATGELIVGFNEEITETVAKRIMAAGIEKVKVRSVLTCRTRHGVCAHCYGRNLATGRIADVGEAVGIIAAQSIGEPGTQLTMRTFHTGGVAGEDITQGLPRVEELFEARKPKGQAIITEVSGTVKIVEVKGIRRVSIITEDGEEHLYQIPYGARLKVRDGSQVEAGDRLTEGSVNPHDILKIKGIRGVQMYLVHEVQEVYRSQGVEINDKHIEVVIRQMLRKRKVENPGDTDLLPGSLVDVMELEDENQRVEAEGGTPAVARPVLLGITKASLATESFLSAASFQETTRVLTDAAIKGKRDDLIGLKENVIIGKLIPAGTGMPKYRVIDVRKTEDNTEPETEQLPTAEETVG